MDPSTNGPNGRDDKGRFVPGHPGGPGNPFARACARLRSAMMSAVSEKDIREIVARLVWLAKDGDLAAAKLILTYTVGRPPDPIDPDRVDIDGERLDARRRDAAWYRQLAEDLDLP